MAATKYTYSISTDFPNGKVATDRLTDEIQGSAIVTALESIVTGGDDCDVWFKEALSTGDETILDGIVAAHSGEPLEPELPIMRVKSVDAEGLDPDKASSLTEGVDVDTVIGQGVTEKLISFTYPVDFVAAQYCLDDEHWEKGDKLEVAGIAAGDPHVDVVIAAAYIGDNWVMVSGTVFDYVKKGYLVKFGDEPEEYRIKEYDVANRRMTLSSPLTKDVPAMSLVRPRRPFVINHMVKQGIMVRIGDLTSGSSKVDTGDIVRIRYIHKTAPIEVYTMGVDLILLI
jgi:hypothetical protein